MKRNIFLAAGVDNIILNTQWHVEGEGEEVPRIFPGAESETPTDRRASRVSMDDFFLGGEGKGTSKMSTAKMTTNQIRNKLKFAMMPIGTIVNNWSFSAFK